MRKKIHYVFNYFLSYLYILFKNVNILISGVFKGDLSPWPPFGMRNFFGVFTNKFVNFLVNFCEYILKITLSRRIFQPKMHQIAFGSRAPPGPAGGAYNAPQTPYSWIKRSLV